MAYRKNVKKCGILLPVFSLPNRYGIGSFGEEAYRFVDFLKRTGQHYWQVLPLTPTSYGDSPYQSPSAFAGNPYFIDLDLLLMDGLLTAEECKAEETRSKTIDYARLYERRYKVLYKAYARFWKPQSYYAFVEDNREWLLPYATFMALKERNGGKPWNEWTDTAPADEEEVSFWIFLQFEFYTQWHALKSYANARGVQLIGDMPIYVAYDSADVWRDPQLFQLDRDVPVEVAGVPPDDFSAEGQLWGNPLYRWEAMKEDGYGWWKRRMKAALDLYDIVRIDHFRGFSAYYAVPYGESTAKNGSWKPAPGKELFAELKKEFPDAKIIAEDLGVLDDDVRSLLKQTGFPGMKVAQFGFSEENSEHNPKNFPESCIAYTGTHDNPTAKEWQKSLGKDARERFEKDAGKGRFALVKSVLQSAAETVILPLQDYMGLGSEGRINTPSTLGKNWVWRLKGYRKYAGRIKRLCAGR